MEDFDVQNYCRQLCSLKPPPYKCPAVDCDKVFSSMTRFQYHLAHIQNSSPIPPLDFGLPKVSKQVADVTITPIASKAKSKKKKETRFTTLPRTIQPEMAESIIPVLLSKTLCEAQVSNNKIIRFDAEDHLPLISKEEFLKGKKDFKTPNRTTAILASLEKSKEAIKKLPLAAFKEIDDYNISVAPPMPTSYIRFIEKTEEELDNEVEYDMDQEDFAWLEIMNERREVSGLEAISMESFEQLMDRLEKESYLLVQMNKEVDSNLAILDDAICCICLDGECQNSNVILFCDMCNIAVHQECYGVPYIPEGQWFCRRCIHSPSCMIDCILCPNKGGAFKQTDHKLWAHVVCAFWIPEVRFANAVVLEPIDSIERIPAARWKLNCYICKQRDKGACIQCHKTSCYVAFHVTCAQQAGLYMKMETIPDDISSIDAESGTDLVKRIAFCNAHSPADYLADNPERQLLRDQLDNARRVLAKNRSVTSDVPIPTISPEKVTEIAKLLSTPNKGDFLQRLIAYWKLKRHLRNGAPLLRRLQISQNSNVSRREKPIASNGNEVDLVELNHQLKYCKILRQDLERVRILCQLVHRRERLKRENIKVYEQYTLKLLWPFHAFLQTVLQQLITKDTRKIFTEPVDQNEVPDYGDKVKRPMDFQIMEMKMKNAEYNTLEAVESDFNLMVSNCLAYNSKETIFYKAGVKMRDQGGTILRTAKINLKQLKLDPVSMMLTEDTREVSKTTVTTSKINEEIKDEFDHELKEMSNSSNTMGDEDRKCKLPQLANKYRDEKTDTKYDSYSDEESSCSDSDSGPNSSSSSSGSKSTSDDSSSSSTSSDSELEKE